MQQVQQKYTVIPRVIVKQSVHTKKNKLSWDEIRARITAKWHGAGAVQEIRDQRSKSYE